MSKEKSRTVSDQLEKSETMSRKFAGTDKAYRKLAEWSEEVEG